MEKPPPPPVPGVGVWVGGWVRGQKNFVYLKSASNFPAPFDKFHFLPQEKFSDVGGGAGQGSKQTPPLPPGVLKQ